MVMPVSHKPEISRSTLTLKELEVLRALVDCGTTIAAAEQLGISQPAVSRTLTQLEAQLGRQLFDRQGGRLVATPDARLIDAELDSIFAALARIEAPLDGLADSAVPLYVAAPPTIAHSFLAAPAAQFARQYPNQQLLIEVLSSDVLVTYVAEGRVDLGIVDTQLSRAGVRSEPFCSSDIVCLMRRDDPLATRDVIVPQDLDGVPFISQTRRHSVRTAQDAALSAAGARPRAVMEVATVVLAAQMVREGLGVALVNSFPTALRLDPALCTRPFEPRISMQTCFMTPASVRPSAATLAFMALVRRAVDASTEGQP
jgi:DNA-binding transcriptional LysR family regulator